MLLCCGVVRDIPVNTVVTGDALVEYSVALLLAFTVVDALSSCICATVVVVTTVAVCITCVGVGVVVIVISVVDC